MAKSNTIKIGPTGPGSNLFGGSPSPVTVWDEKGNSEIARIFIWHNSRVCSIQFQYVSQNPNEVILSNRHGHHYYGNKFDIVQLRLDPSMEYITCVSGFYSSSSDGLLSLKFGTNRGVYGPFGGGDTTRRGGEEFCYKIGGNGRLDGFHGTFCSSTGMSIGIYFKPFPVYKTPCLESKVKMEKT